MKTGVKNPCALQRARVADSDVCNPSENGIAIIFHLLQQTNHVGLEAKWFRTRLHVTWSGDNTVSNGQDSIGSIESCPNLIHDLQKRIFQRKVGARKWWRYDHWRRNLGGTLFESPYQEVSKPQYTNCVLRFDLPFGVIWHKSAMEQGLKNISGLVPTERIHSLFPKPIPWFTTAYGVILPELSSGVDRPRSSPYEWCNRSMVKTMQKQTTKEKEADDLRVKTRKGMW